ncbi:TlpA family protein disulfide reductase [Chitinophaga sp. GCM10012297]|uniref:TlpA family protein disulfide reductase n=1 Tax=Chitinophaga chungangae TaxID=2821488 RepID=A0ABS3YJK3_9BACT|nr:TlpA disulfide reductase family protein [Chitinophaga chungangae]MBO9154834.1 TlpA family protein disulfide reductase [Chitinophaga chungangae]
MTLKRFLLLIAAFFIHHSTFSQNGLKVKIFGDFENLPDGRRFYLTNVTRDNTEDTLQIVKSSSGKIEFNINSLTFGEYVFVRAEIDSADTKRTWILLIIDTSEIKLSGDFGKWPEAIRNTSVATAVYQGFFDQYEAYTNALPKSIVDNSFDTAVDRRNKDSQKIFTKNYINEHINSSAAAFLIYGRKNLNAEEKAEMYKKLQPNVRDSKGGLMLKQQIAYQKIRETYKAGVKIPDYVVELPDGKKRAVWDMVGEAKYTLIDFWAYWCGPCRKEMPGLKEVYSDFTNKGFNIIGISIDPNRSQWKKALSEIDTPWDHAIDTENTSKELFSLEFIPGYVLLNQKAEIVAMDIIGQKIVDSSLLGEVYDDIKLTGEGLHKVLGKLLNDKK